MTPGQGQGAWRWFLAWLLVGCAFSFSILTSIQFVWIGGLIAGVGVACQALRRGGRGPWCGVTGGLGGVAIGVCFVPFFDGPHAVVVYVVWMIVGLVLLALATRWFLARCESATRTAASG